eukprot:GHVL01037444.1.p1 GENE.GHVL01037444.1~~GHVL01037444.1.p1  ORF type:complete len:297 (-),score=71.54 GHVL01037444.1:145-1035(-)
MSIGIRRETKSPWETRSPLTPDNVKSLVNDRGLKVFVQPSSKRVFSDEQYEKAGATISESIAAADIIIGVKEVPINELIADKTYMFFSHTIKAQNYNMGLLDELLKKKIKMIDYECIRRDNRRLVAFGELAGVSGMLNILYGVGMRMLSFYGLQNPFLKITPAHCYLSVEDALERVESVGKIISNQGLPREVRPFIITFTGITGNVSRGSLKIFKKLPNLLITGNDVLNLVNRFNNGDETVDNYGKKILYILSDINDIIIKKDNNIVNKEEYYKNPHLYEAIFYKKSVFYMVNHII